MPTVNLGRIIGPEGPAGKSAYQYAQEGGFEGSEQEFTEKLATESPTFADLRAAAPVNLLDNSDFRYPVAQAGVGGKHGNQAYAADRWILTSGSVSHQAGVGLALNGTITQKMEQTPSGAVSAFVGMASGQASISYSDGAVTITSSGGVIAWAALYQGTYTEETMPEYRPKGYGAELAECQRYFYNTKSDIFIGQAYIASAGRVQITLPAEMRINPTIDTTHINSQSVAVVPIGLGIQPFDRVEFGVTSSGNRNIAPDVFITTSVCTPHQNIYVSGLELHISADL